MITIYHLHQSQSDRIVWLMEELGLPYELEWFERGADMLAPPEYTALHPMGTSPTIRDGDLVMAESTAIVQYIAHRRGNGQFTVAPDDPAYADYVYWMMFNSNAQTCFLMHRAMKLAGHPEAHAIMAKSAHRRQEGLYKQLDARLAEAPYLAGDEFTLCEIMAMTDLTTLPAVGGRSIDDLPNAQRYVELVSARPAYQKAMAIAGPTATRPE
jgi:glutathione S-transferase